MTTGPLRIAIADDELDMREFLGKVLPRLGHTVVASAENGQELIEACLRTSPDLIITDLKMPVCDGETAVKEIWKTRPVPVIVISAYADQVLQGPWAASPWVTVLMKPVRMNELEPAITESLTRFRQSGP